MQLGDALRRQQTHPGGNSPGASAPTQIEPTTPIAIGWPGCVLGDLQHYVLRRAVTSEAYRRGGFAMRSSKREYGIQGASHGHRQQSPVGSQSARAIDTLDDFQPGQRVLPVVGAKHIFEELGRRIEREGLWVHRVTAWESDKACASYLRG